MKTRTMTKTKAERRLSLAALLLTAITILAMLSASVLAYPSPDGYVSDSAGILDEDTIKTIRDTSDALFTSRGARIAVCTVNSTDSESVRDYAAGVFKDWNVGNGVLLLLVKYPEGSDSTDTFYAVQSNSVSDTLTNTKLSEILNTCLESSFAAGNFAEGTTTTVKALSDFLSQNLPENFGKKSSSGMPAWLSVLLKIIVVIAVLLIAGYIALVILERRAAERRRLYLEDRRRRMARDGHAGYRPMQQGAGRPNQRPTGYGNQGYGRDGYGGQEYGRPGYGNPSGGNRRTSRGYESAAYPEDYDTQGYGTHPTQPARRDPRGNAHHGYSDTGYGHTQSSDGGYGYDSYGRAPSRARRTVDTSRYGDERDDRYDPQTAATVQINTADIRAARASGSRRDGRRTSRDGYDDYDRYDR